jgi:hypothetical protein
MVLQSADSRFVADFDDFVAQSALFGSLQGICFTRRDGTARLGHGWYRNQVSHPHQVISRCREGEDLSHLEQSAMFQFAQQRGVFPPTEDSNRQSWGEG